MATRLGEIDMEKTTRKPREKRDRQFTVTTPGGDEVKLGAETELDARRQVRELVRDGAIGIYELSKIVAVFTVTDETRRRVVEA